MNRTSNVIDLSKRLQARSKVEVKEARREGPAQDADSAVLDMTERREAILLSERREVKRTILSEFIGAFILIPEQGLQRVAIYDISENGIAFDLDAKHGGLAEGEEVAMRVYLNQFTYFPFIVSIANVRYLFQEGVTRHGCNFMKETVNEEALHHFVRFIETVSASLKTDHGDVMV
ncbi:MAG: PilZ domain-containing protein, partial [Bdellovibrionales bacterium]|nr:PilZ domain-containing protein [Bdellovibrionales bacterium]